MRLVDEVPEEDVVELVVLDDNKLEDLLLLLPEVVLEAVP